MKNTNAIALVANEKYFDAAKQVIVSSFQKGNWKGDYILLTNSDESSVSWFIERGVKVFFISDFLNRLSCSRSYNKAKSWPMIVYAKLFLLHPIFKQWKKIIYLDCDVIVRKEINKLLSYEGFCAKPETMNHNLLYQFVPDLNYINQHHKVEIKQLKAKYNFNETSFNVGVMVFHTAKNTNEGFENIFPLYKQIHGLAYFPEQAILNLYFYKNWTKLPYVFNDFYLNDGFNRLGCWGRKNDEDAVILHFVGNDKPWEKESPYYDEWLSNFQLADNFIDLNQNGKPVSQESINKIMRINKVNQLFGKLGRVWWRIKRNFQKPMN